jgi:3-hydroxy-3-methylglutaryl CoA synthase
VAGIASYGAYVPPTRLAFATIGGKPPKEGEVGPERSVAWNDEDAITMGVAAGAECLRGFDRAGIDAVFFASTTQPFREKQAAALVAKALGLRRDVATADHAGSLRAGLAALRAGFDAVAAGSARRVLVVVGDCRLAAPGSGLERSFGDGAVAFLLADADAIARFEGGFAVADELVDLWRGERDRFVHSWEERFVLQEGYAPYLLEAVRGLLERSGASVGDFAKVALFAPDERSHAGAARALRIERERLVDPLFGRLGNTGAAFAPMLLASALESARPGERLLVAGTGDGADALALRATEHVEKLEPRRGVAWHLARRRPVRSYERYLKARGLDAREWEAGGDPGLSATIHFREREEDIALTGQRCRRCGAHQFPRQRVCESCFAKDDFELVRLADKTGRLVTYTLDFFFPTPDPPTIVAVVDVEGARLHMQLADAAPQQARIGLPVEFRFRRIHQVGGRPNYYWKAVPLPGGEGT